MIKKRITNGAKIEQKGPSHTLAYRLFKRFQKKKGGGGGATKKQTFLLRFYKQIFF